MSKASEMYQCQITYCKYVYDPEVGNPKRGIPPGTSFADLPEDWTCPFCGAGKKSFRPLAGEGSVLWENIRDWPEMTDEKWREIEQHLLQGDTEALAPVAKRAQGKMV